MQDIQYSAVQERLNLAKQIFEQSQHKCDLSLVRETENGGWTHPVIQYDALVNYLLLTCFDSLGQPSEGLSFDSWLTANKTKREREEAAARINQPASPAAIAKEMYNAYQKIYGVKSSFYRFIDEILDKETRERLLTSIRIEQRIEDGKATIIDDPEKKKSFLYESRNLFTHRLKPTGSAARAIFPDAVMVKDNKISWGYSLVRTDRSYAYFVRKYPFELFEIISSVIGQPIEVYDFNLECRVFVKFESGAYVCIENVRFSSLRDLSQINNAALRYLSLKQSSGSHSPKNLVEWKLVDFSQT
jgi:hypothetical protein